MASKKWVMIVKHKGGSVSEAWREDLSQYNKALSLSTPFEEVGKFAQVIIDFFNSTLREGEKARELVEVKKVDSTLYEGSLKND